MQFDWTTFALEILNFLVLVWILQRFLYRPVTAVIARRAAEVENRLTEAQTARTEARALKLEYENRTAESSREKEAARAKLQEEMALERAQRLEGLNASLEAEREKRRATERQRLHELQQQVRQEALAAAGAFVARLFARLSSPELEAKICEVVVEDLAHLAAQDVQALRRAAESADGKARVASAYALDLSKRNALVAALSQLLGGPVACEFGQDAQLVAGLRITLGSWVIGANLKDEMRMFVEAARDVG